MQFMCKMLENQYLTANQILYQANTNLMVDDNKDLQPFVTSKDLAHYVVMAALADMPRMEIKANLLKCSSILTLLECYPETADVFDSFMNGRW